MLYIRLTAIIRIEESFIDQWQSQVLSLEDFTLVVAEAGRPACLSAARRNPRSARPSSSVP